jgi:hypothetical protein
MFYFAFFLVPHDYLSIAHTFFQNDSLPRHCPLPTNPRLSRILSTLSTMTLYQTEPSSLQARRWVVSLMAVSLFALSSSQFQQYTKATAKTTTMITSTPTLCFLGICSEYVSLPSLHIQAEFCPSFLLLLSLCYSQLYQSAQVLYVPYAMGRDKRIWGEDALSFNPSRFLAEGGEKKKKKKKLGSMPPPPSDFPFRNKRTTHNTPPCNNIAPFYNILRSNHTTRPNNNPPHTTDGGGVKEPSVFDYPAFNAGPRMCLGKPLALLEIKLVTGLLLQNFDFELASEHKGGYTSTLVLPMDPGLLVKLKPRMRQKQ